MYRISNDTKKKLESVLLYFAHAKDYDTRYINMRIVAALLAKKLSKTKKSESK